jgi:dipeptidyl aminopeptidase/acylaminoacyl peptidase
VDARDAPGLLFAGTADPYIPYQWSVDAATALQLAGVHATLVTLDGAGHVPSEYTDRIVRESRAFLYDRLELG